ncbi:MAG: lysostaphin resistance A-like protein [Flavobacteriales bacterium]
MALLTGIMILMNMVVSMILVFVFHYFYGFNFFAHDEIIDQITQMSRDTGLSPGEAARYGFDLLPEYIPNYQYVDYAKWFLILNSQLPMLFTGICFLWVVYKKPLKRLSPVPANAKMYLLAAALFFLVLPLAQLIGEWNQDIYIPWPAVQNHLLDAEIKTGIYSLTFTDIHSISELMIMILFIGIVTSVAEELVFRAGLQNILLESKMNPHVAIWLGAAIFSIMHLQFYGFFVRLFLGVLLGYLYYWTKDIRTNIVAHALNNSLAIIMAFTTSNSSEEIPGNQYIVLAVFSALAIMVLWLIIRLKVNKLES